MSFPLLMAWLTALSLAFMVMFDRLMVGDCYQNKPAQAWLVSSVSGGVLGLTVTVSLWLLYATFDSTINLVWFWHAFTDALYPTGFLIVGAGALAVEVLRWYFMLLTSKKGHSTNETAVAVWLATAPVWIFISIWVLHVTGYAEAFLPALARAETSPWFGLFVIATVLSIVMFEKSTATEGEGLKLSSVQVETMLICIVLYTIILSVTLEPLKSTADILALLPYYWLGFLAGIRTLFKKEERRVWQKNWSRLKKFIWPIAVAEIIGMLVFYLEFFALAGADPTMVNLIISAHVLMVYGLAIVLRKQKQRMQIRGVWRVWILGIRLKQNKLPDAAKRPCQEFFWLVTSTVLLSSCLSYIH